jgi:hypothetical protein
MTKPAIAYHLPAWQLPYELLGPEGMEGTYRCQGTMGLKALQELAFRHGLFTRGKSSCLLYIYALFVTCPLGRGSQGEMRRMEAAKEQVLTLMRTSVIKKVKG